MVKHRELGSRAGVTSVTRQEVAAVARSAASWTLPLAQLAYQSLAWRRCRCDFILVARTPGVRAHRLQVNRPCSQASHGRAATPDHGVEAGSSSGGFPFFWAPPGGCRRWFPPGAGAPAPPFWEGDAGAPGWGRGPGPGVQRVAPPHT